LTKAGIVINKKLLCVLLLSLMVSGCATSSKHIATAYVSPLQYQTYDCRQLSAELSRINSRISELGGTLDSAASNDKVIAGVSVLIPIFLPALFALGGTAQQEAEYSRLKGEYEAADQTAIAKRCHAVIYPTSDSPAPTAAVPTYKETPE
jgi:hypothetical protein